MARILIADDDPTVRDMARRALQSDGHVVEVAADGGEALDHIRAHGAPDIMVTDVDMPNLNGIALAIEVAKLAPATAVVLMSGYVEQLSRSGEIKARSVTTLRKPFTLEAMRQTVRGLVG